MEEESDTSDTDPATTETDTTMDADTPPELESTRVPTPPMDTAPTAMATEDSREDTEDTEATTTVDTEEPDTDMVAPASDTECFRRVEGVDAPLSVSKSLSIFGLSLSVRCIYSLLELK